MRRQQPIDQRLQPVGLADDHLRVLEERSAIELAYLGGHTYREVASLLDVENSQVLPLSTGIRDNLIEAAVQHRAVKSPGKSGAKRAKAAR